MQVLDIYYIKVDNFNNYTKPMHDLKANFDKILPIVNHTLHTQLNEDGNLQYYPHRPAFSDAQIMALALLQEALGIDSERWLWSKLQTDYAEDFPALPHRTRYNHRRKRLADWIHRLAQGWSNQLCPHEDTFLVDSLPVPVAHVAREHSTNVCREHYRTAPDKGYNATFGQYYIGYKLHMIVSLNGVYRRMELTKASVHDIYYLQNIKTSGLTGCLLLADKGYLSGERQTDLFESAGIDLQTPMRRNQTDYRPWPTLFKTARRRVETVFSQLCDQMRLKHNYAKTFAGLRARIITKIASFTLLQYINYQRGNPINHIKHALAYEP